MNRRGLLATIGLLILVAVAAVIGSAGGRVATILDLDVGDCMLLPSRGWDGEIGGIDVISCDAALSAASADTSEWVAARVEAVGVLAEGVDASWPGADASIALATRWCQQSAAGGDDVVPVAPDADTWATEPRVVCLRLGR